MISTRQAAIFISVCLFASCVELLAEAPPSAFVPEVLSEAVATGNAAFEKKDYAVACKAYERVLKLEPDNLLGCVNLGMVEFYMGNKDRAEELLKKRFAFDSRPPRHGSRWG